MNQNNEDADGALWAASVLDRGGRHTDASELVSLAARFRAQGDGGQPATEPVLHLVTVTFPGADGTPSVWEMCGPGPVSVKIDPMRPLPPAAAGPNPTDREGPSPRPPSTV